MTSASLTGDDAKLGSVLSLLDKLPGRVKREGLRRAAYWAQTELLLEFTLSRAPDGTRWAKLKRRRGAPLVKTHRLEQSWRVRVAGDTFVLATRVPYARFHQFGASYPPRVNAHKRNGRFKSRKSAEKAKRLVRVSVARAWNLTPRPMLPGSSPPPRWRAALEQCFREAFEAAKNG